MKRINKLYAIYLSRHHTEPFVMLDEMNLTLEQFKNKIETDYAFRHMWS
jgi:hypothetical protein